MSVRKLIKRLNVFFLFMTGIGALAGGVGLIFDPTGGNIGISTDILPKDIFPNFLLPGLFLFLVIGVGHIIIAIRFLQINSLVAWKFNFIMGLILVAWISIQVLLIGYLSILQPISFGIGLIEIILALMWKKVGWQPNRYHF